MNKLISDSINEYNSLLTLEKEVKRNALFRRIARILGEDYSESLHYIDENTVKINHDDYGHLIYNYDRNTLRYIPASIDYRQIGHAGYLVHNLTELGKVLSENK